MKIHRFIIPSVEFGPRILITDREITHQIARVLNLTAGESVILSNGTGRSAQGTIKSISSDEIVVSAELACMDAAAAQRTVMLYVSILKRDNFELVVQKAAELGVHTLVPIISERTVKTGLNVGRLKVIAREASELSGQSMLMNILEPLQLAEAITTEGAPCRFFLNAGASISLFEQLSKSKGTIALAVGPEGGWTKSETQEARAAGWTETSLALTTLRGETAAIAGAYLATQT